MLDLQEAISFANPKNLERDFISRKIMSLESELQVSIILLIRIAK
jgi:hypothetical protein